MSAFVIRDGTAADIPACLKLDHSYETDRVWQMQLQEDTGRWQIGFRTERLPRTMDVIYPVDEARLRAALPVEECLLVAEAQSGDDLPDILGYLALERDPIRRIGWLVDIAVDRAYRRQRIGQRLLNIGRRWAVEHDLDRMIAITQTKNFPAITFCVAQGLSFSGYNDRYYTNQDIAVYFADSLTRYR